MHFFHLGGGLGEAEVGEAGRPGRRSVLFCSTPSGRGGEAGERWLDRWWRPRPACCCSSPGERVAQIGASVALLVSRDFFGRRGILLIAEDT